MGGCAARRNTAHRAIWLTSCRRLSLPRAILAIKVKKVSFSPASALINPHLFFAIEKNHPIHKKANRRKVV